MIGLPILLFKTFHRKLATLGASNHNFLTTHDKEVSNNYSSLSIGRSFKISRQKYVTTQKTLDTNFLILFSLKIYRSYSSLTIDLLNLIKNLQTSELKIGTF